MATPRNISKTLVAGTKLRQGRFNPTYVGILDVLAAAAPGSWVKVNTNRFQDAWEHPDFRAPYNNRSLDQATADTGSSSSPHRIIAAWCSYAWDDDNMRLVLFGGGHGNASNSEVYTWDATTRNWRLAFRPTSLLFVNEAVGWKSAGGWLDSPTSAHTYSNQAWLPKNNRFITFGGANPIGTPWVVADEAGVQQRVAGPFTLDLTQAYQGYVAGSTGTNVKRAGTTSAGVTLTGVNAWRNRDWRLDHPLQTTDPTMLALATVGRSICVTEENGRDVIYFQGNNGTSKDLFRCEIVDINDYKQDLISWVGYRWSNNVSDACASYDPKRKLFFNPSFYNPGIADFIGGWDLRPGVAGPNNRYFLCPASGVVGPTADVTEFVNNASQSRYGTLYDERRDKFVVFSRLHALYEVRPPADFNYTTGWSVKKIADESVFAPMGVSEETYVGGDINVNASLTGRWRRSKRLDVYILLRDTFDGNVWMYKPTDWLDPRNA